MPIVSNQSTVLGGIQHYANSLPSFATAFRALAPLSAVREGVELNTSYAKEGIKRSPSKRILVVDDDPAIRDIVVRTVARVGFRADTARDGEEGWTALNSMVYDLIITDHEMPKLTGLAMIKRMRAVSVEPPCILISGNLPEPEPNLQRILYRGTVLAKPFSCAALIEKVRSLLRLAEFQADTDGLGDVL